jgi:hypothetical protein
VRLGRLFVMVLALSMLPAGEGQAHRASHQFESVLEGISPEALAAGIETEMLDSDSQVRLENESGEVVVVDGYEGEPYARLDPDGAVFLNTRSPAYYLNRDRYARTPVDPSTDPAARPKWIQTADGGELVFYDRRSHYISRGAPPGLADPDNRELIRRFTIPLRIDGRSAALDGSLYWIGRNQFPMGIAAGLLVATFLCAGFAYFAIGRMRRGGEDGSEGTE